MTVHMAYIVSITVRLKLSITVRLGNIVYHSTLEALRLSITGRAPEINRYLILNQTIQISQKGDFWGAKIDNF
jgi:hypothetical protein